MELDHSALLARAKRSFSAQPRPFIKWAGSKRALLPHIVPLLPATIGAYYEPFLGSAALFFLLLPQSAHLADACNELINTYRTSAGETSEVLSRVNNWAPNRETYYYVRDNYEPTNPAEYAARFIYLNRYCWNGLYRVNLSGRFNVPYGRPKTTNKLDSGNFEACAAALAADGVSLTSGDFEVSLQKVKSGDLVFLDPPYVTQLPGQGFREYNDSLFSWHDQERLARVARELAQRGANILVTNTYCPEILELYQGFHVTKLERSSTIAGQALYRGTAVEALISSSPTQRSLT